METAFRERRASVPAEKAGPSTPQLICKQLNWLGRDDRLKITLSSRAKHNDSLANRYAQSRDLLYV